ERARGVHQRPDELLDHRPRDGDRRRGGRHRPALDAGQPGQGHRGERGRRVVDGHPGGPQHGHHVDARPDGCRHRRPGQRGRPPRPAPRVEGV
ncbi:MAG: hypothetical protein AVDCRST_MAG76-2327, partial [uncultured Acidimicrobiales bacterium]